MPTDHRRGGAHARRSALLVLALASLAACSGSADARPRADARGRSSEVARLEPRGERPPTRRRCGRASTFAPS